MFSKLINFLTTVFDPGAWNVTANARLRKQQEELARKERELDEYLLEARRRLAESKRRAREEN